MESRMEDIFSLLPTDLVGSREAELHKMLDEVRAEIEENEMVHGIPLRVPCTVPLPKDSSYFRKERKRVINRMTEVSTAKPVVIQADVLREETLNTMKPEYTKEGLPLLLHEYFTNRMHEMVQAKYLHMLRWKRFCEHTSTIEALYPCYQKRINQLTVEYKDCLNRAKRLAVAKEAITAGNDSAAQYVKVDDLIIYLRYLICHHVSVKKFDQYLKVLQWFHVSHKDNVVPKKILDEDSAGQQAMNKFSQRYEDVQGSVTQATKKPSITQTRADRSKSPNKQENVPNPPPLVNPQLFTTNPQPATAFLLAAAAAGGGLPADSLEELPLYSNSFSDLKPHIMFLAHLYDVESNIDEIDTTADEMELYAAVLRVFKKAFVRQETMKTFKVYDCVEIGSQNWGADHSSHALKKDCNWLKFVTFKLHVDPVQEKEMTQLRHRNNVDELLRVQSKFLQINDSEKSLEVMKAHAKAVRYPQTPVEVSVRSHKTEHNPGQILQKIYGNPDAYGRTEKEEEQGANFDPRDVDNVRLGPNKGRRRRESYDYGDTVQMLGLEEGGSKDEHTSSIQGGFMSFLYLRHLRLRDLQRTCLSVLNYFRSIERTLTINACGLAHENGILKCATPLGHKTNNASESAQVTTGSLNSHAYMHNTPADYCVAETEFMDFSQIENHDDFYCQEEGRIHVQDQRGYYIMYEESLNDLKKLEDDLLLVASHYIQKDQKMRKSSKIKRQTKSAKGGKNSPEPPRSNVSFDVSGYAHSEVDRFGVMLDLWTQEACFLENKMGLLNCYMEAYHHVFNKSERQNLAQVMYNVINQRPRFDFSADYFARSYHTESVCLRLKAGLVKGILDTQIDDCRQYVQRVCREVEGSGELVFGLPLCIIPHQPISLNLNVTALKNVFMLEYHPSLSIISRLPEALKHAIVELQHIHKPESVTACLEMEKEVLELAMEEWDSLPQAGASYAVQVQKELFSGVFVEDPLYMCEVAQALIQKQEQADARKTKKERQAASVETVGQVMDLVTLRHRMIDASWETELLSKMYKQTAVEIGFDECHLFMRFLQFDYAVYKKDAGKPPPLLITSIQDDDSAVDRLIPKDMPLAIHELDESGLGRFSFRSRENVLLLLRPHGIANVRCIVMSQVAHKNTLIAAVQQTHVCGVHMKGHEAFNMEGTGRMTPTDTKSEKSSLTMLTGFSGGTKGELNQTQKAKQDRSERSPEAFISIQLEKTPFRDLMLNEFLDKKKSQAALLKNAEEAEKLKRNLILTFNHRLCERSAQYSLRGQIIHHYNGILTLLNQFPNIRETYFVVGEPNEKKSDKEAIENLEPDPRTFKHRPRLVVSDNGENLLNLWFIPHHSEVLIMFKHLNNRDSYHALHNLCLITGALHDIMQYLCGHSKLGSGQALLGSQQLEFVSADWGGTEGIGAELREIQKQISNLINPNDPGTVAKFLQLRRDVMFLTMDTAVRHSMRDTFLASGNSHAYQAVTKSLHYALPHMSNETRPSLSSAGMTVPYPLEAHEPQAKIHFPWRSFLGSNGPFSTMLWQSHQIGHNLQTCLCGLKDVDRHVANGEILGVSLLLEDILQFGNQDSSTFVAIANMDAEETKSKKSTSRPPSSYSMVSAGRSTQKTKPSSISRTRQPIEAYELLKHYLVLWKATEVFKCDWSLRRLMVNRIDNPQLHRLMCKEYKEQKLFPVLQSLARRTGNSDMYEGITHDTEPLVMPPNVSEIEIKAAQLLRLVESLEEFMIIETMKKLTKDINLAFAERGREEGALPTDLWKKPNWKENFTVQRPELADGFAEEVMRNSKESEDGEEYIVPRDVWDTAIKRLGSDVLAREKFDYESYTSYYEALLKVNTQLLYSKEQEIKLVKGQLLQIQNNYDVEVQCRLADRNQEIIMEVTALRAQVQEMKENAQIQEKMIRERQREEYNDLVQNLFTACFTLKQRLDEYREEIYEDVCKKVTEQAREADQTMATRLSIKYTGMEPEDLEKRLARHTLFEDIRGENYELHQIIARMKVMHTWKINKLGSQLRSQLGSEHHEKEFNKRASVKLQMLAEQEIVLLRQQILALRKALGESEKEAGEMRKELDKEMKTRKEKLYSAMQYAANQRQLELAKAANVEKLLEELEQKELQMKHLAVESERSNKLYQLEQERTKKGVSQIKKQLNHERNLKLDAFQRVDVLQAQTYEVQHNPVRAQTALGVMLAAAGGSALPSRATTATARATSAVGGRARTTNESLNNQTKSALTRPKTTTGRLQLRSRVADQLLNDLERTPQDAYETVQALKQGATFVTQQP